MERLGDELATIDLGDKRLNARALLLAERMAAAPTKSIPTACHGWAETQAAYRLLDTEGIDAWSVLDPHIRCTEQRMRACPIVLCLQDTTSSTPGIRGEHDARTGSRVCREYRGP